MAATISVANCGVIKSLVPYSFTLVVTFQIHEDSVFVVSDGLLSFRLTVLYSTPDFILYSDNQRSSRATPSTPVGGLRTGVREVSEY
jgi:hypothetical protein